MKDSLKRLASDRIISIALYEHSGDELTLAVGETDGQGLGLRLTLAYIGGGVPDPAAVAAYVGRKLHIRNNYTHLSNKFRTQVSDSVP